jgi:hypothetical protein
MSSQYHNLEKNKQARWRPTVNLSLTPLHHQKDHTEMIFNIVVKGHTASLRH